MGRSAFSFCRFRSLVIFMFLAAGFWPAWPAGSAMTPPFSFTLTNRICKPLRVQISLSQKRSFGTFLRLFACVKYELNLRTISSPPDGFISDNILHLAHSLHTRAPFSRPIPTHHTQQSTSQLRRPSPVPRRVPIDLSTQTLKQAPAAFTQRWLLLAPRDNFPSPR